MRSLMAIIVSTFSVTAGACKWHSKGNENHEDRAAVIDTSIAELDCEYKHWMPYQHSPVTVCIDQDLVCEEISTGSYMALRSLASGLLVRLAPIDLNQCDIEVQNGKAIIYIHRYFFEKDVMTKAGDIPPPLPLGNFTLEVVKVTHGEVRSLGKCGVIRIASNPYSFQFDD